MDVRALAAIVATGAALMSPAEAEDALSALIGSRAAGEAPALVGRSLETFLAVETAYKEARYSDALRDLEALWQEAPPADARWVEASRAARELAQSPGLNIGHPPCYYSLRMLTDCVRWRIDSGS
ncbi:MAG: hypothetical protein FJX74_22960, partial [Armatimonadetes bacterium]|nr:hypothetical protein [Armatimonadota bacterium]